MDNLPEEDWDIEITPKNNLFDLKLKDVWHYRDLLILLVRRDFVAFYKQTILGPIWFFVQPVITIITYTIVFGNLAGIPTDGVPKPLFYLAGTIIWNYFADCLTKTSTVFKDNAAMLGKVYFPRLIMPAEHSIVKPGKVCGSVNIIPFFAWALLDKRGCDRSELIYPVFSCPHCFNRGARLRIGHDHFRCYHKIP